MCEILRMPGFCHNHLSLHRFQKPLKLYCIRTKHAGVCMTHETYRSRWLTSRLVRGCHNRGQAFTCFRTNVFIRMSIPHLFESFSRQGVVNISKAAGFLTRHRPEWRWLRVDGHSFERMHVKVCPRFQQLSDPWFSTCGQFCHDSYS